MRVLVDGEHGLVLPWRMVASRIAGECQLRGRLHRWRRPGCGTVCRRSRDVPPRVPTSAGGRPLPPAEPGLRERAPPAGPGARTALRGERLARWWPVSMKLSVLHRHRSSATAASRSSRRAQCEFVGDSAVSAVAPGACRSGRWERTTPPRSSGTCGARRATVLAGRALIFCPDTALGAAVNPSSSSGRHPEQSSPT